jgi:hypothetical protein
MNFRYAVDLNGAPSDWSDTKFKSPEEARAFAWGRFDGPVWTAWVEPLKYSAQLANPDVLIAEMKEHAALNNRNTSCFDELSPREIEVLGLILRNAIDNWESWLPELKRSTVVNISHVTKHQPT